MAQSQASSRYGLSNSARVYSWRCPGRRPCWESNMERPWRFRWPTCTVCPDWTYCRSTSRDATIDTRADERQVNARRVDELLQGMEISAPLPDAKRAQADAWAAIHTYIDIQPSGSTSRWDANSYQHQPVYECSRTRRDSGALRPWVRGHGGDAPQFVRGQRVGFSRTVYEMEDRETQDRIPDQEHDQCARADSTVRHSGSTR